MRDLFAASAIVVATVFTLPAHAQTGEPDELYAFEAALDRAVPRDSDEDWRFTLTFSGAEGELVARFDGAQAETERWQLVSPAQADLTDEQREIWEDIVTRRAEAEADEGGLFFSREDARYQPGSLSLHLQDADDVTYRFAPVLDADDAEDAAFAEHLNGEITVGRHEPGVRHVRLWAPESFKPNFAVRVSRFEVTQEFADLEGLPAPVMVRMRQDIAGNAAFQSFEESFEIGFSEIEYLGNPAR
ncbi:MAG: hypothetical protein U9P68_05275 [Pseudomonadota bacterium]|nr:hypothetical protein [Pseudomonadota bacterium]